MASIKFITRHVDKFVTFLFDESMLTGIELGLGLMRTTFVTTKSIL